MKKRFKIIITTAMLAMSLALMSFGVYAATSHTLSVNNYIQFDLAGELAVTINGKTGVKAAAAYNSFTTDVTAFTSTADEGANLDNASWTPWTSETPAKLGINSKTITWMFEINNDSQQYAIKVNVYGGSTGTNALAAPTGDYSFEIKNGTSATTAPATVGASIASIAKGGSGYFSISLTRTGNLTTNDASATAFPFRIVIEKVA